MWIKCEHADRIAEPTMAGKPTRTEIIAHEAMVARAACTAHGDYRQRLDHTEFQALVNLESPRVGAGVPLPS